MSYRWRRRTRLGTNCMRYAEYPPSPRCAGIVDRYWFLEGHGHGAPEPIFPDGRIEIVFHFRDPFERHHPHGAIERQGLALMVGQMREPICIAPRGRAGVAGIRRRPSAGRAIAGCRADEISGSFVDVEAICGSTALLRERLIEAADDRARVALSESWLTRWVVKTPSKAVDAAVAAITSRRGIVELPAVAGAGGISVRQLERRFLEDVGLAPKMFARLVRLQSALRGIANGWPLADVAIACGYYDQAHMARDFNRLAEPSPAAWRRHAGVLTPLFVAR